MTDNPERDAVPPVEPGKVRFASPGSYPRCLNADYTPIASATGAIHGYPTVTLRHITRGFVVAGSMMRWQEARWSVTFDQGGATHGRSFTESDEAAARAYFAEITNYEAVSRMRQQQAMREDVEREELAAAKAKAEGYTVEAAKRYRSGWQWRCNFPGMGEWCGFAKTKRQALADGYNALIHRIRYA